MPGDEIPAPSLYVLDNSTISQIFRSFYPEAFPSFWERFDELVLNGSAVSVRHVCLELENARRPAIARAPGYLKDLNRAFFHDPSEQEQLLVRTMTNDSNLSDAAKRWISKSAQGTEDADPYLVAKVRVSILPATVVTEESPDSARIDRIPAVCQHFGINCINLQQLMGREGWRF